MQPEEFPDLKMTPMDEAMAHLAELIDGLKKAGLSEASAVRFAAIYFAEGASSVDDDPDDD
jgi:hypothetical protein